MNLELYQILFLIEVTVIYLSQSLVHQILKVDPRLSSLSPILTSLLTPSWPPPVPAVNPHFSVFSSPVNFVNFCEIFLTKGVIKREGSGEEGHPSLLPKILAEANE